MIFKDLDQKQIFTWWQQGLHTGCKVGERQAFCFDSLEIVVIHANKKVNKPEPISEDHLLRFGPNGQAFLCLPLSGGNLLVKQILLTTGVIMTEDTLTPPKPQARGDIDKNLDEVYIILELIGKKLLELENLHAAVRIILQDGDLSLALSNKKIMSTLQVLKLASLDNQGEDSSF